MIKNIFFILLILFPSFSQRQPEFLEKTNHYDYYALHSLMLIQKTIISVGMKVWYTNTATTNTNTTNTTNYDGGDDDDSYDDNEDANNENGNNCTNNGTISIITIIKDDNS